MYEWGSCQNRTIVHRKSSDSVTNFLSGKYYVEYNLQFCTLMVCCKNRYARYALSVWQLFRNRSFCRTSHRCLNWPLTNIVAWSLQKLHTPLHLMVVAMTSIQVFNALSGLKFNG